MRLVRSLGLPPAVEVDLVHSSDHLQDWHLGFHAVRIEADHYTVLAGKVAGLDTLHQSKTILVGWQVAVAGLTAQFLLEMANTFHKDPERLFGQ